jgi:hypothetical protein
MVLAMAMRQVVQVQILGAMRTYTYDFEFDLAAGIAPLAVGDTVELPPNQVQEEGSSGKVVALGSPYQGPMKSIVRKLVERQAVDDDPLWGGFGEGDFA